MKMTVSYEWLCGLVKDLNKKSPEEIGLALTATGAETEEISILNYGKNCELAEITEIQNVNNNNFNITIKTKSGKYTVLSNCTNLNTGDFVIFAPVNSKIFGDKVITAREIDGIKTEGLLLALENLGIEQKSSDIIQLGQDKAKAQEFFDAYCEEDAIYTLDVPGNRADWLSIRGLARALSIYFSLPLKEYDYSFSPEGKTDISIDIQSNRCNRYSITKISNINNCNTSARNQKRLLLLGMRPINYLVDISNLIMLETGQPTHAFDAKKITGKLIIRQAKENEKAVLLDESEVTLSENDLLICDEEKILALAGIMGCLNSGVDQHTSTIYLESANFNSVWIRRSAKRLGIKTESSLRFEKNITPELVTLAQKNICESIHQYNSSCIINNINDIYSNPQEQYSICISPEEIRQYLGASEIDNEFIKNTIIKLGCGCDTSQEKWIITPCGERMDLRIKEDIIEEIARFYGYDNIPSTPYRPTSIQLNPEKSFDEKIRPVLRGMGLSEAVTMVFRSEEQQKFYSLNNKNSVTILNPLNTEWSKLRTHLFDGLLESIKVNISRAFKKNIALSEIASVFSTNDNEFYEQKILAFGISNEKNPYQKGLNILNNICTYSKIFSIKAQQIDPTQYPFLHPLNSFEIIANEKIIGFFGEIHPELLEKLDLSDKKEFPAPVICEILFDTLKDSSSGFQPVSQLNERPPVFRDITLTLDENHLGINLIQELKDINPLIKDIEYISVFQNEKLKELKMKNISLKLRFESEKEINSQEIDQFIKELIDKQ